MLSATHLFYHEKTEEKRPPRKTIKSFVWYWVQRYNEDLKLI